MATDVTEMYWNQGPITSTYSLVQACFQINSAMQQVFCIVARKHLSYIPMVLLSWAANMNLIKPV